MTSRQVSKKKQKTCLVLFDVEKAFDKTCHTKLIEVLMKYNIPIHLIKWVKEFLTLRRFTIKVDDQLSDEKSTSAGTP